MSIVDGIPKFLSVIARVALKKRALIVFGLRKVLSVPARVDWKKHLISTLVPTGGSGGTPSLYPSPGIRLRGSGMLVDPFWLESAI